MRIVYCIAATANSGGMERVLANKANFLASCGHEVFIVTTDQRGRIPFFDLDEKISCVDLDINYELNNGKSIVNKLLQFPGKQITHKRKLSKFLKTIQADIVVSMFCNDEAFLTDIKDGSKKILEIHFSKFKRKQYGRKGLWRIADKLRSRRDERVVKKFHKFVVLTEEDKTYWGPLHNIMVIPNSRTFHTEDTAKLECKKVIAIGRYSYQKGFDILINVWKNICAETADWHLDIIGDGILQKYYEEKIRQYSLQQRISLVRPMKTIGHAYLNASVVALSSRYEGLPMILLEAQAYGLPVVAFECKCGPKDVITDGKDGFLVPEADIELFTRRLLTLMKDTGLRKKMGAAAKINSENYNEEKIMAVWLELFETLLKK